MVSFTSVDELFFTLNSIAIIAGHKRGRLGKNKLHELRGVQFKKKIFHQICQIFRIFLSLNVQISNNFKNIFFIAIKLFKIFKYYENSMVLSCSTCQKEEKKCMWVK